MDQGENLDESLRLSEFIDHRFGNGIVGAFAYGSSIFRQLNDKGHQKMIDLILIVKDPHEFHQMNIFKNPDDYSFLKYMGPSYINRVFHETSSGLYFNPFVTYKDLSYKYGIISEKKLMEDLADWTYLYIAGRLHKPVFWLKNLNASKEMKNALKENIKNALETALIFLPQKFDEYRLFLDICELSYQGDCRLWLGVDRNKSERIVWSNFSAFQELYRPLYSHVASLHFQNGYLETDVSNPQIINRFERLPTNIRSIAQSFISKSQILPHSVDVHTIRCSTLKALKSTVRWSSLVQLFKAFPTSGIVKSGQYIASKIQKSFP